MEELLRQMLAVAGRFLQRREDTEDVAQETILRVLKARSEGTTIVSERAFATRTAVRLAIDRLRLLNGRARKLPDFARHRRTVADLYEPPADVRRLYDAIAALPPKQAALITLRKLMELEYPDIAAILGISIESCRSHCRLGLKRLRETVRAES